MIPRFFSFFSKTPNSGVTRLDPPLSVTAYKNHDFDPVLISGGDSLVFRAGEITGGCGDRDHCPDKFCSSPSSGLLKRKSLGMYIVKIIILLLSFNLTYHLIRRGKELMD